ncbi:hypothetical protein C9374_002315 [Naegleria lovaniensis]|uniref:Ras family small GTPase n=1 Tax=Naegleria lovaniensis TaxID=51637 RepID=A0AA88GVF6_NAELO|nr:uncharacterized protein C9374_002315 [Naegleria lovaniensis]KAG2386571.1 hypothetical protein C9374_002315 [Naegleria lovaniensis]
MSKHEFTVVVVGPGGVGKTSLTINLTEGRFEEEYNPTIEDSYQKVLNVNNERVLLNIIDTAGQEDYQIRDQHFRSGDGFLLVFDVTSKKSFEEIPSFYDNILKSKEGCEYPVVLCGNKCDLPASSRAVTDVDAKKLCETNGWMYFDTSAKQGLNVQKSFEMLCKMIIDFNTEDTDTGSGNQKEEKPKKQGFLSKLFKKK